MEEVIFQKIVKKNISAFDSVKFILIQIKFGLICDMIHFLE